MDGCERTFLGECFGIGLRRRWEHDPHVEFVVLVEDDGSWFVSSGSGSSYWAEELLDMLTTAIAWMKANCQEDPTGFGWVFP